MLIYTLNRAASSLSVSRSPFRRLIWDFRRSLAMNIIPYEPVAGVCGSTGTRTSPLDKKPALQNKGQAIWENMVATRQNAQA